MLCIPILFATAFYLVALVSAHNLGACGAVAFQRLLSGDHLVFVYCTGLAALSWFVTKKCLSECFEDIRIIRRQLDLRRA